MTRPESEERCDCGMDGVGMRWHAPDCPVARPENEERCRCGRCRAWERGYEAAQADDRALAALREIRDLDVKFTDKVNGAVRMRNIARRATKELGDDPT